MPRDDLRPRQVEQVGVAGDVARVVAEALAAVGLLAADLALDQHAPGAVEDRDAVPENGVDRCADVRHSLRSRLTGPGAPGALRAL